MAAAAASVTVCCCTVVHCSGAAQWCSAVLRCSAVEQCRGVMLQCSAALYCSDAVTVVQCTAMEVVQCTAVVAAVVQWRCCTPRRQSHVWGEAGGRGRRQRAQVAGLQCARGCGRTGWMGGRRSARPTDSQVRGSLHAWQSRQRTTPTASFSAWRGRRSASGCQCGRTCAMRGTAEEEAVRAAHRTATVPSIQRLGSRDMCCRGETPGLLLDRTPSMRLFTGISSP